MAKHAFENVTNWDELAKPLSDSLAPVARSIRVTYDIKSDAEDLVQDALLKGVKIPFEDVKLQTIHNWAARVMSRKAIDEARHIKHESDGGDGTDEKSWTYNQFKTPSSDVYEIERGLLEREELSELQRAIPTLPDDLRQVIELSYYKEMLDKQIADQLNLNINTVKTRLRRARQQLKEKLVCGLE